MNNLLDKYENKERCKFFFNIKFYRSISISKLINSLLNEISKRTNFNIIENDLNAKFINIINQ